MTKDGLVEFTRDILKKSEAAYLLLFGMQKDLSTKIARSEKENHLASESHAMLQSELHGRDMMLDNIIARLTAMQRASIGIKKNVLSHELPDHDIVRSRSPMSGKEGQKGPDHEEKRDYTHNLGVASSTARANSEQSHLTQAHHHRNQQQTVDSTTSKIRRYLKPDDRNKNKSAESESELKDLSSAIAR